MKILTVMTKIKTIQPSPLVYLIISIPKKGKKEILKRALILFIFQNVILIVNFSFYVS